MECMHFQWFQVSNILSWRPIIMGRRMKLKHCVLFLLMMKQNWTLYCRIVEVIFLLTHIRTWPYMCACTKGNPHICYHIWHLWLDQWKTLSVYYHVDLVLDSARWWIIWLHNVYLNMIINPCWGLQCI